MTIEQQRYLESCKKVLDGEQMEIVTMALDYGLQIPEIRKVVQGNLSAVCMREVVSGMMEGIHAETLDFLCENDFNRYQIKEIIEGLTNGLTLEQVKTYAVAEMSASRMRQMRRQLEETALPRPGEKEDGSVREYMKGLMEVMETSIRQFRESNERFDALLTLVKEHVVDEKNREIQELYENLQYKDKNIQQLQQKLAEREKKITELEAALKSKPDNQASDPLQGKLGKQTTDLFQRKPDVLQNMQPSRIQAEGKKELDMTEAEDYQRLKKRMVSWLAFWNRGKKKDIFGKIMESNLSPQQLEEVGKCLESGLTDEKRSEASSKMTLPRRRSKKYGRFCCL